MFGSSLTIGSDILDIGSQKFDRQSDERAIGSGAMIPRLALGEPGQFEVPNVADVRSSPPIFIIFHQSYVFSSVHCAIIV